MRPTRPDRRPIHHSPIFWIGVALCLAAIAIYLWSDDLAWRPAPAIRSGLSRCPSRPGPMTRAPRGRRRQVGSDEDTR